MRTPLVHIGYPKTASTWLQKRLFPLQRDVLLLRRATPGAGWIEAAAQRTEFEVAALREQFQASVATAPDRIPVVSYEAFVGDPFGGGRPPGELAERVRALIPEARIALVVREPVELLESLYRQYVQIGGLERPGAALAGSALAPPVLSPGFLHFDRIHDLWEGAFGPGRVRVLLYEELVEDPRRFVGALLEFAGAGAAPDALPPAGANRGTAGAALAALRFSNRFAQSRFNREPWLPAGWVSQNQVRRLLQRVVSPLLGGGDVQRRVFDAATRAELREHFRPHNRALAKATGRDLSRHGYSV